MNAQEARALVMSKEKSRIADIYDRIRVSAELGSNKITLQFGLTENDQNHLLRDGYGVKVEEETMHGRPSGWITTISW